MAFYMRNGEMVEKCTQKDSSVLPRRTQRNGRFEESYSGTVAGRRQAGAAWWQKQASPRKEPRSYRAHFLSPDVPAPPPCGIAARLYQCLSPSHAQQRRHRHRRNHEICRTPDLSRLQAGEQVLLHLPRAHLQSLPRGRRRMHIIYRVEQ